MHKEAVFNNERAVEYGVFSGHGIFHHHSETCLSLVQGYGTESSVPEYKKVLLFKLFCDKMHDFLDNSQGSLKRHKL